MINFTIKIVGKKILFFLTILLLSSGLKAQLSGPKTIPTDYATIADFVTDVNLQGVGVGGVTFTIPAGYTETAPAGGYVITASGTVTDAIVITGGGLPLPVITASPLLTVGNLNDAIFVLHGADAVTIQGLQMQENPANAVNTPAANNNMTEWGVALIPASITNGAQFNTIQGNTISLNRIYTNTCAIYSNTRHNLASPTATLDITATTGSNSDNKIYGNTISNVNLGISFVGSNLAANMDTNNDIGGSSALTGNNISDWGGAGVLSGYISVSGTSFGIYSNHQIGENISNNVLVSAVVAGTAVSHRGILKDYTTAQPSGTFTTTISNNTITLSSAFTSGVFEGIKSQGITPVLPTATLNIIGNTIINSAITGAASSSALVGISNSAVVGILSISNSIIQGNTSTATTGGFTGILNSAAVTISTTLNNNQIGNSTGGAINFSAATSGAVFGISNTGGANTCNLSISNNDVQGIVHSVAGTSAHTYLNNTAGTLSQTFNNNTFTNLTVQTSGNVRFMQNDLQLPAGGSVNANNNSIVTQFNKTVGGGTVFLYFTSTTPSSPAGTTKSEQNNNFSNITLTGATTMSGWADLEGAGGGGSTKTISNNTFSNWICGTNAVTVIQTNFNGTGTSVSNNVLSNITGGGAITGLSLVTQVATCNLNNITNLSSTGTGGTVIGITLGSSSTLRDVTNNTVSGLSSTGASSTVTGIAVTGGTNTTNVNNNNVNTISGSGITSPIANGITVSSGTTVNIFKNKIYDITQTAAITTTSPCINGILMSGGTTVNCYNNLVSGLTAPNASLADAIRGISVTSATASTTFRVYYNSVYLNATSTGPNFGTTGLFHTVNATATTANFDVRNNIIINESVAAGTGLTVAYRRSGVALNNYAMTSNRNLFYAGVPSATNLIFTDGTTPQQVFSAFQLAVATREVNSFSGEAFVYATPGSFFISLTGASADFLRPVAGITTQVEGGGTPIGTPAITDDYSGVVRNVTTPDLGAHEFNGITPAPVIVLNSVTPGTTTLCATTARLVSVDVTTVTGTITGATLLYSFNGTPQAPIPMVNTVGTTWEATIPVATPVNAIVSWSVVADNSIPLSASINGTSYFDEPLFGLTATATATPATICDGETSSLSVLLSNPAAAPSYIAPPAVSNPTTDEDFGNITITQGATTILNNTTVINTLNGTIGVATGTNGSYSNFTAFGPYNLTLGQGYNFSVSSLQPGTFNNAMAIYIDYNRNGLFNDPGEQVYTSAVTTSGPHTETGAFTVPASAMTGVTRMRVSCNEGLITSPTQTFSWGEYEEYSINLVPDMTVITWSDGVGTIGTGTPIDVTPSSTTTYSAEITALGCVFAPDPTALVTVNALPTAPTASNSSQCGTQIPTASVTSTTLAVTPTFNWYDAPTAGVLVQSSTSTTFTSNITVTTTFYVSELDGVTGCESLLTPVTVTVTTADAVDAGATFSTICIGNSVDLIASNTNPFPVQNYTYTWTGVAGSGADVPVIGSTVTVTPTIAGTYTYDLNAVDGGCTALDQVVVIVDDFTATVAAVDISCFGFVDGTFTLSTSNCGTTPYLYSVDGSPFGAIPTNLAAGTYTIVIQDDNGYVTAGQMITIVEPTTIVGDPTTTDVIVCQDDLSAMVDASGTTSDMVPGTLIVTFDVLGQPTEINAAPGNTVATATYTLPAGAVVTGGVLDYANLTAMGGSWMSDIRLGFSGAVLNAAAQGTGSTGVAGTFNYTRAIPAGAINPAGGSTNLLYWDFFSDNAGAEATFPVGTGVATLTINYTYPEPSTISWWDNATAGTQLGTGAPFESVGTSVVPNTSTPGVYTLYAQGQDGVCASANRTPVTVTVLPSSDSLITVGQCDPYTLNATTYSSTGIFTQTLVNMVGCDSIITIDLTIYPVATSTTTITACDTYDWTDGNTYTVGGTYTQTLVSSLGCDSIATLDLTMVTTPIATVVDNGDATVTSSFGNTYEWIDCATLTPLSGETSQTATIVANGSYAVVVTLGGVCTDTSDCVLINYIGVEEADNVAFKVYPNPTRDQVTITMNASVAMVEVLDAQGKLLQVVTVENGGQIDLSTFDRGVYYLRIKTDKESSLHRIVRQ